MNSKILGSVLVMGVAAMMMGAGALAVFSDTERSDGNTFQAGSLDLKIDLDSSTHMKADGTVLEGPLSFGEKDLGPNDLFFNWTDVKPGDKGEATISVHVENNAAWLWIGVDNLVDYEMGQTEPEADVDPDDGAEEGELSDHIMVTIWKDNGAGDHEGNNILDPDESPCVNGVSLSEMQSCFKLGKIENCTLYYYGVSWEVPLSVGNEIQTDMVEFDVIFYAEQYRNNSNPQPPAWCQQVVVDETPE